METAITYENEEPALKKTTILQQALFLIAGGTLAVLTGLGVIGGSSVQTQDLTYYSTGLTDRGYYENITAKDYVTLPDLSGLTIPKELQSVTEEAVQTALDSILTNYQYTAQVMDRAVADGDQVNIDYVGSVDGVEFAGGNTNGQGTLVQAGSSNYIDDFLTQIIDVMPGETIDVEVTFPEEYPSNPDLAGKDAVFVTTVNYISETVTPELTDEFVAEHGDELYQCTTADALRQAVSDQILDQQLNSYTLSWAYENAEFAEVPQTLIDAQNTIMARSVTDNATAQGVDVSMMLTYYYGVSTMEELQAQYAGYFEAMVQQTLLCQAIAEDAGITVGKKELKQYATDLFSTEEYKPFLQSYGEGYVYQNVLIRSVLDHLLEVAVYE